MNYNIFSKYNKEGYPPERDAMAAYFNDDVLPELGFEYNISAGEWSREVYPWQEKFMKEVTKKSGVKVSKKSRKSPRTVTRHKVGDKHILID